MLCQALNTFADACAQMLRLSLADSARNLLSEVAHEEGGNLLELVSSRRGQICKSLDVAIAREFQENARRIAWSSEQEDVAVDENWLLSRLVEAYVAQSHRPFCKFCYRTVALRRDGGLKELCAAHASDPASHNRGGYLRGFRFSDQFIDEIGADQTVSLIKKIEIGFLRHHLNSTRKGAGSAKNVLLPINEGEVFWGRDAGLSASALLLPEICHDFPDWTEVAIRWRWRFGDEGGADYLGSGKVSVTPRMLIQQWMRWKAWLAFGDANARVGKGRPAKINKELALEQKAKGATYEEIAEYFGVSKVAVAMFFSRLKKKSQLSVCE